MLEWLWSLHTGEALGTLGRLVWFLAGLSLCFLYVTGVLDWLYRHGKIQDRTRLTLARCAYWKNVLNKDFIWLQSPY